jgi:PAS domain S-box-containing protein
MKNKEKENIKFLEKAFDLLEEAVIILKPVQDGKNFIFLYANKAVSKIEKIKKQDLIGKKVDECFPDVKEFGFFDVIQKVCEDGKKRKHPIKLYKDKRIEGWRENVVQQLSDKNILITYKDLSEQKKQEEELKEKNQFLRVVLDSAPFGIYIINEKGNPDYVNDAMLSISAAERERFMNINFFEHENYRKHKIAEEIKRVFKGKSFILKNIDYKSTMGRKNTIRNFTGIPISEGNKKKALIFVEDITEIKEKEEEIRVSKERLDIILHSIQVGVVIIDREKHKIIDVNDTAAELIGLAPAKIIGNICHKFICPAQFGACPITDLGQKVDHSEKILINKNGREIPIYKTVTETNLDGRLVLIESFIDINEQKESARLLEAKNKQLEKFNKFVVDRELKMVELKKRIKKLEEKKEL